MNYVTNISSYEMNFWKSVHSYWSYTMLPLRAELGGVKPFSPLFPNLPHYLPHSLAYTSSSQSNQVVVTPSSVGCWEENSHWPFTAYWVTVFRHSLVQYLILIFWTEALKSPKDSSVLHPICNCCWQILMWYFYDLILEPGKKLEIIW